MDIKFFCDVWPYDILKTMGVIYKITDKLKSLIIIEKKHNPRLSCRALVDSVYNKFDITLSKSSINNVLKQADLSSPVGRRPSGRTKRRKKFQIPEKRKKQIFPSKSKPSYPVPVSRVDIKKEEIKKQGDNRKKDSYVEPNSIPAEPENISGIDGLGGIFLRASQEELFGESFLGWFLREFSQGVPVQELNKVGDLLLFMRFFGIHNIDELDHYKGTGLWFLLDQKDKFEAATVRNILKGIQVNHSMIIKLLIELKQRMQLVKSVKVITEDLSEYFLDPRLFSVWDGNVQSDLFISLRSTLEVIIKQIVENVQSVAIKTPFSFLRNSQVQTKTLPEPFIWFIQSLEGKNIEKRIKRLIIFDVNDQEIVSLDEIPSKNRVWSCGVWPGHDLYDDFNQLKFMKCRHFDPKISKNFTFLDISPNLMAGNIRFRACLPNMTVLKIMKHNQDTPALYIITNTQHDSTLYKLAWEFISLWYQKELNMIQKGGLHSKINFGGFLKLKSDQIYTTLNTANIYGKNGVVEWLGDILHEYTKIRYFNGFSENTDAFIQKIYSAKGNGQILDNLLMLHFDNAYPAKEYLSPFAAPFKFMKKNLKI